MDSFNFLRFLQVSVNFLMFDTVDGRSHAPVDMVNICKYHQISYYLQGFIIPSRKLTYHREVWKIIDLKVPLKRDGSLERVSTHQISVQGNS